MVRLGQGAPSGLEHGITMFVGNDPLLGLHLSHISRDSP